MKKILAPFQWALPASGRGVDFDQVEAHSWRFLFTSSLILVLAVSAVGYLAASGVEVCWWVYQHWGMVWVYPVEGVFMAPMLYLVPLVLWSLVGLVAAGMIAPVIDRKTRARLAALGPQAKASWAALKVIARHMQGGK